LGVGLTILPCKKKIVEKPSRNSAGFCGEGQGLSWAVKPRKEERIILRDWRKLRNQELHNLYSSPDITTVIKWRMRLVGYAARMY
jgi:hypothetical protein